MEKKQHFAEILKKVCFLGLLILAFPLWGQGGTFPVQVIPQMIPPPPIYLSSYADASTVNSPLRVQIILNDLNIQSREVRLKAYFQGSGLTFQSNDFVTGANQLFLEGGVPLILTNAELAPYFRFENITGISPNVYGNSIPEGTYQFCFEVFDIATGNRLSNKSCVTTVIFKNEPPFLVSPRNKTNIAETNPQNIIFQWTPRSINVTNAEYELSLVEIWDTQIDPQAAFLSSPPIFQITTAATTYVFGPSAPQLLSGKNYAWRIQAKAKQGTEEIGLFKNQGYSEIFSFSYASACDLPLSINHEVKGSTIANIFWDDFSTDIPEYTVRYRKKSDSNSENEWFFNKTTSNTTSLWDLKSGTIYEYQIQKKCTVTKSDWSITKQFTTFIADNEESVYECGITPDFSLNNTDPLQTLAKGDKFTAGDFPINILEVSGSNGRFTGKGYVTIPYLNSIRVGVKFTNILVNTEKQMAEGTVITMYDATLGNLLDIDEAIETVSNAAEAVGELFEGDNDLDEIHVNWVLDPKNDIKIEDGVLIITNPTNGAKETSPLGDDKVIVDSGGNVYHIDAGGNVTEGGKIDPSGSVTTGNVTGVSNQGDLEALTADGIKVIFEGNGTYGYDQMPMSANDKLKKEYTIIPDATGNDYTLAHVSVEKEKSIVVTAKVELASNSVYTLSDLKFKTKTGELITASNLNTTNNTLDLSFTGRYTLESETIYAVVNSKQDSTKQLTAGAFTLWHLTDRVVNVVLVSVDGAPLPNQNTIKNIFKKGVATLNFDTKTASLIDTSLLGEDGKLEIGDSPWLTAYNKEQKDLIKNIQSQIGYDASTYYVLVFNNSFQTTKPIAGFMPLQRQFGFVFNGGLDDKEEGKGDLATVTAHELGHGVFALQHPFTQFGTPEGATDWLMDYKEVASALNHMNWAQMHNPNLKFYTFQDEEDGEISAQQTGNDLSNHITSKMKELGNKLNSEIILVVHCETCSQDEALTDNSFKIEEIPLDGELPIITFDSQNLVLQSADRVLKNTGTCINLYYSKNTQLETPNNIQDLLDSSDYSSIKEGVWIYDDEVYEYDCSNQERLWGNAICQKPYFEINEKYITNLFDHISKCEPLFKDLLVEKLKESKLEYNIYSKGIESWVNGDDRLEMVFDYTGNNLVVKKEDFTKKIEDFLSSVNLPSPNEAIYFAIVDATTSNETLDSFRQKGNDLDVNLIEGDLHITHIEIKLDALGQIEIVDNEAISKLKERATAFEERYNSIFHESNITLENYQEDIAKRYATNFMSTFEKDGLKENLSDSDYSNIFDNGVLSVESTIDIINKYLESKYAEALKVNIIDANGLHSDDNVNGEEDIVFLINQVVRTKSKSEATRLYDAIFPADSYDNGLLKKFVDQFSGVDIFVADGNYEKISKEIRNLWIKVNPQYEATADFIAGLQESNKIFPLGLDGAFASDQESCTPHFLSPEYGQYDIEVSLPKGERIATQTYNGNNAITTYHCNTESYTIKIDNYAEPVGLYLTSPVNINGRDFTKGETIIVPAFMLFQIKDEQLNKRIATYVEVGADVALTFTGIGNLTKIRHLTKVQKAFAIYEVASSTLDISARIGTEVLQKNNKLTPSEAENIKNVTGTLAGLAGVAEIGYKGRQLFLNYIVNSDDFAKAASDFNKVKNDLDITSKEYIDLSKAFNNLGSDIESLALQLDNLGLTALKNEFNRFDDISKIKFTEDFEIANTNILKTLNEDIELLNVWKKWNNKGIKSIDDLVAFKKVWKQEIRNISFDDFYKKTSSQISKANGNKFAPELYEAWIKGKGHEAELESVYNKFGLDPAKDYPPCEGVWGINEIRGPTIEEVFDRFQTRDGLGGGYAGVVANGSSNTISSRALMENYSELVVQGKDYYYYKFKFKEIPSGLKFEYGEAIPWFDDLGGAIQVKTSNSFQNISNEIEVIEKWKMTNGTWTQEINKLWTKIDEIDGLFNGRQATYYDINVTYQANRTRAGIAFMENNILEFHLNIPEQLQGQGIGAEILKKAISDYVPSKVKGWWKTNDIYSGGESINLTIFKQKVNEGFTPIEAAFETPTGKILKANGFDGNVEIIKNTIEEVVIYFNSK